MDVGICFGCFILMHTGHTKLIRVSMKHNDHTILGICGFDEDRGERFIPFRDRIKLVEKAYGRQDNVTLSVVDDKKIGLTGKFDAGSWRIWCDELFKNSGFDPHDTANKYTWYSGEQDYPSRRKTPSFSYGDIRRVCQICVSN